MVWDELGLWGSKFRQDPQKFSTAPVLCPDFQTRGSLVSIIDDGCIAFKPLHVHKDMVFEWSRETPRMSALLSHSHRSS